jgi:hypothetical protein
LVKGLTNWTYLPADSVPFSPVKKPAPVAKPTVADAARVLPLLLSAPTVVVADEIVPHIRNEWDD